MSDRPDPVFAWALIVLGVLWLGLGGLCMFTGVNVQIVVSTLIGLIPLIGGIIFLRRRGA